MVLCVVSTGGTISSTDNSGSGANPGLDGAGQLEGIPAVSRLAADVETRSFDTILSHNFTVDRMYDLLALVRTLDDDASIDGIVVTQGTNTLETVSYFVDLCYDGDTPVVFTGAMRNPSLASPDGPGNLLTALLAAQDEAARGRGVLVAFNYRIHTARDVQKLHAENPDGFQSPEFGPIAAIDERRVTWHREAPRHDPIFDPDPDTLTSDVHAVIASAHMPSSQFTAARDAAAVCFAGLGPGHVPESIVPALEELRRADVPLVATSICPSGRVLRNTYDVPGGETTLQRLGCYYSDVNVKKSRIKTIVALADDGLDPAFERPRDAIEE